eukprot:10045880-Alexandrium_andersonii.AAC.1
MPSRTLVSRCVTARTSGTASASSVSRARAAARSTRGTTGMMACCRPSAGAVWRGTLTGTSRQ